MNILMYSIFNILKVNTLMLTNILSLPLQSLSPENVHLYGRMKSTH